MSNSDNMGDGPPSKKQRVGDEGKKKSFYNISAKIVGLALTTFSFLNIIKWYWHGTHLRAKKLNSNVFKRHILVFFA